MQEKSRCTLDRTTNLSHGPFNDAMEKGSLVVQWSFRFGTNSFLPWVEKIKDIRKATQQYKIKFLKSTQTRLQTQIKNSNSWKILNKKKAFPSRNKVKTLNQGKKIQMTKESTTIKRQVITKTTIACNHYLYKEHGNFLQSWEQYPRKAAEQKITDELIKMQDNTQYTGISPCILQSWNIMIPQKPFSP